jgi:dienelactone hydrolase
MRPWLLVLAALFATATGRADVVTKAVEYRHGNVVLEGSLVYDSPGGGRRPGVLVAHDDGGTHPLARQHAARLARLGYIAFALDLYGKGVQPQDPRQAGGKAGLPQRDRPALRARAEAGLGVLRRQPQVDPRKLAAVGYGIGGTAVLELARGNADLEGVVCIHGDPSPAASGAARPIQASVLVLLGADDPFLPPAHLAAFEQEMRAEEVDWQVIRYGAAVHGFTNPRHGRDRTRGLAYDATADRRAAEAVKAFLAELFPASPTRAEIPLPPGVPAKVAKVLQHVDETATALDGYEGGRNFLNLEKLLPEKDAQGRRLRYREWDVNPLKPGVNRGPERLVTGSDGSAYFTGDHYRSFKRIR